MVPTWFAHGASASPPEVEPGQVPGGGGEDAAGDTEGGPQEADTGSGK